MSDRLDLPADENSARCWVELGASTVLICNTETGELAALSVAQMETVAHWFRLRMDEVYRDEFLESIVDDCECCDRCHGRPCDGVAAGGLCDGYCACSDDDDLDDDVEDEGDAYGLD